MMIHTGCSVVFEEFLVWEELSRLIDYSLTREDDFRISQVVAGSDPAYRDHRRSRILLDTGQHHEVICERIAFYLPQIVRALAMPMFTPSRVESQITTSNHGDYFKLHEDNTRGCPPTRELSYVYYFHREPKRFEGGELLLYSLPGESASVTPERVAPSQNTIVFFASARPHEVSPVTCATGAFSDGRFTLNGWIHRA